MYYSFFDTNLLYECQAWGQGKSDILFMVQRAHNKALRIRNFKEERHSSEPLLTEAKILNLTNIITLKNLLLVFDYLNNCLPAILNVAFKEQHSENTKTGRSYI